MKKLITLLATLIALSVTAQTVTEPVRIDWRFTLYWDDPNPLGETASWKVFAFKSDNAAVFRQSATRSTSFDLSLLLSGAPAGIYQLYTIPVSQLGADGEAGTNYFVLWPGGNGKLKGGANPRATK